MEAVKNRTVPVALALVGMLDVGSGESTICWEAMRRIAGDVRSGLPTGRTGGRRASERVELSGVGFASN